MKIIFDSNDEKAAFNRFFKKLILCIENGVIESGSPEPPDLSFDDFWRAYPLKKGKKPAQLKFERLNKEEKELCVGSAKLLRREFERRPAEDANFIPHASTFINQRRWEDAGIDLKSPAYSSPVRGGYTSKKDHSNPKELESKEEYLSSEQNLQKNQELMNNLYTPKDLAKDESDDNDNKQESLSD